jgi:hypothetical protein
LLLPQASQAQGSAQFPRLRLLLTRHVVGLLKTDLRLRRIRGSLSPPQLPLDAVALRIVVTLSALVDDRPRLGQQREFLVSLADLPIGLSKPGKEPTTVYSRIGSATPLSSCTPSSSRTKVRCTSCA